MGENLLQNLKKLQQVNFQENVCINEFAINEKEMEKLERDLNKKCKEPEIKSTLEVSTEFNLEEEKIEIESLILRENLEKFEEKFVGMSEILKEIFEGFDERIKNLEEKIQNCTCG